MLYTKKGDGGTTKLFDSPQGRRLDKNELIFEALGTIDEINSLLGVVKVHAQQESEVLKSDEVLLYSDVLEKIQHMLFSIQAEVGGSADLITVEHVAYLEHLIALVEKEIPPITTFIVYGGTMVSAYLDLARAVSRRCERLVVGVHKQGMRQINPDTLQFLNRLSSVLYALARYSNYAHNCIEKPPSYG